MRRRLPLLAAALALALSDARALAQTITTIAGTGVGAFSPDGSPAATSPIALATDNVTNVVFDADGNLVFSEGRACRVRRIARKTGLLETLAGNGKCGYSGDGGPAIQARLKAPAEVAFDRKGDLYIADAGNNLVRRVDRATGIITTVAGNRLPNYAGDGVATAVPVGRPSGLVFDSRGRLLIAEVFGSRIRRLDLATGQTETIAGKNELNYTGGPALKTGFAWPNSPRFDAAGALVFCRDRKQPGPPAGPEDRRASELSQGTGPPVPGRRRARRAGRPEPAGRDRRGRSRERLHRGHDEQRHPPRRREDRNHHARRGDRRRGLYGGRRTRGQGRPGVPLGLGLDGKGDLYVIDAHNYRIRKIEGVAAH